MRKLLARLAIVFVASGLCSGLWIAVVMMFITAPNAGAVAITLAVTAISVGATIGLGFLSREIWTSVGR